MTQSLWTVGSGWTMENRVVEQLSWQYIQLVILPLLASKYGPNMTVFLPSNRSTTATEHHQTWLYKWNFFGLEQEPV